MDAEQMQEQLICLLTDLAAWDERDRSEALMDYASPLEGSRVRTFEEAMVLTRNAGLVLRLKDQSEFQITIVQSA